MRADRLTCALRMQASGSLRCSGGAAGWLGGSWLDEANNSVGECYNRTTIESTTVEYVYIKQHLFFQKEENNDNIAF